MSKHPEHVEVRLPKWPVILPTAIVLEAAQGHLSDGALATYALIYLLVDHADPEVVALTRAEIAGHRGITKRTLQRHIAELRNRGWIEITNGNGLILKLKEVA